MKILASTKLMSQTLKLLFWVLNEEVARNNQKLEILSGQFNDVTVMAIRDNKRMTKLEGGVAELQSSIH